jgi:hypothetical protein
MNEASLRIVRESASEKQHKSKKFPKNKKITKP